MASPRWGQPAAGGQHQQPGGALVPQEAPRHCQLQPQGLQCPVPTWPVGWGCERAWESGVVPFWRGGKSSEFHLGHHDDHEVLLIDAVFTDGDVIAQDLPGIYKLLPSHGEGIAALLCLDLLLQCPHLGAQGVGVTPDRVTQKPQGPTQTNKGVIVPSGAGRMTASGARQAVAGELL